MEIKKNPSLVMENKRLPRFLIGLVLALSLVLVCLEWTNSDKSVTAPSKYKFEWEDEELIPITTMNDLKPKVVPPTPPKIVEELEIVKNDEVTDETIDTSEELDQVVAIKHVDVVIEDPVEEEEVFTIVETMPEFPGGEAALRKFIADNIRYPTLAQENGIQGKVVVEFIIGKDGGVYDIAISRSVEGSLDKEAVRVVNLMPKWIPGKKNGKTVKVKYFLPVMFRFQ
jgi:tonB family C-terminal domain